MNGNINELPEPKPDEPPHPNFWSKKWPCPRFGRREPDELLVYFMEWHNLDPDEFRNRKSRYQCESPWKISLLCTKLSQRKW